MRAEGIHAKSSLFWITEKYPRQSRHSSAVYLFLSHNQVFTLTSKLESTRLFGWDFRSSRGRCDKVFSVLLSRAGSKQLSIAGQLIPDYTAQQPTKQWPWNNRLMQNLEQNASWNWRQAVKPFRHKKKSPTNTGTDESLQFSDCSISERRLWRHS
jgi:hypothetical protein